MQLMFITTPVFPVELFLSEMPFALNRGSRNVSGKRREKQASGQLQVRGTVQIVLHQINGVRQRERSHDISSVQQWMTQRAIYAVLYNRCYTYRSETMACQWLGGSLSSCPFSFICSHSCRLSRRSPSHSLTVAELPGDYRRERLYYLPPISPCHAHFLGFKILQRKKKNGHNTTLCNIKNRKRAE